LDQDNKPDIKNFEPNYSEFVDLADILGEEERSRSRERPTMDKVLENQREMASASHKGQVLKKKNTGPSREDKEYDRYHSSKIQHVHMANKDNENRKNILDKYN
jgi:hypothetical protein